MKEDQGWCLIAALVLIAIAVGYVNRTIARLILNIQALREELKEHAGRLIFSIQSPDRWIAATLDPMYEQFRKDREAATTKGEK